MWFDCVFPVVLAHPVDAAVESVVTADDVDLDPQEVDGQGAFAKAREPDGILFGGDDRAGAAGLAALEHLGDLALAEAVMIGVAARVDQFDAKFAQALLETFRLGDAGDHADAEVLQEGERDDIVGEDFLEMERLVRALDELGVLVVAAQFLAQSAQVAPVALGDEDDVGAAELFGRFAQEAPGEEVAVGEGRFAVDKDDVEPFLETKELQAVVEQERVAAEFANGVQAAFDPVLVDEHHHVLQV